MAIRLGELLRKQNLLTQEQLEEALQTQVLFGGKLGTILIEMKLISEEALTEILAKQLGVPCVKPGMLQNIPNDVIRILSSELAEKHKVIPVSLDGRKLTLAMADPHDLKSIDEISFRTSYIIKPVLALEVRLIYALEKYYGIKAKTRHLPPPQQMGWQEFEEVSVFHGNEATLDVAEPQRLTQPVEEDLEELQEEDIVELDDAEVSLETTAQAFVSSRDRNDIADAMIAYLGARYRRAALFMVVADQISGWRSVRDGMPIADFEQFHLSLTEPSVLQEAVDSNRPFLGPVPRSDANQSLLACLGQPVPEAVMLIPMSIQGRVVGLVYLDDAGIDLSQAVDDVQQLTRKALMAFEMLILRNKILRA
ncbi:MAG: hypothetical protein P8Y91_03955 [Desulfuromonadales bacterium]|jgi:hypothetical protein